MKPLLIACLWWVTTCAQAADHAVILMYHHVSKDTPPATSVTPEQFDEHLEFIEANNFEVVSLTSLLDALFAGNAVPENAVAITFDDAFVSVYAEAFPRLRARNWPFSVLVSDEPIDRGYAQYMTWTQLQAMVDAGAEIGGHSTAHDHLARQQPHENETAWLERVQADIGKNVARLEAKLGVEIRTFGYPYGESNPAIRELVRQNELYGLAQQSGAVGAATDPTQIPRFPMLQSMADITRLSLALHSRPLPLTAIDPGAPIRRAGEPGGLLQIRLAPGEYRPETLACYTASGERLPIERTTNDVHVQLPAWRPGRNKINCTAASRNKNAKGEYFWYSHQWLAQTPEGEWPAE